VGDCAPNAAGQYDVWLIVGCVFLAACVLAAFSIGYYLGRKDQ
jgi:hypothetical protein